MATFCYTGLGSGVTLTATATGGLGPYTYSWTTSPSTVYAAGTNTNFAGANGVYNVAVRDQLKHCATIFNSRSVSQGTVPTVNVGPSKKVCSNNLPVSITPTLQYQTSVLWSGGTGTYNPSNNIANIIYTPHPSEVTAGQVKLILTASGGSGCSSVKDSLMIYYPSPLTATFSSASLPCFNSTTAITANISGGTKPYQYVWSTGPTGTTNLSTSINGGQGNYSIYLKDSIGCTTQSNYNLVAPTALNILFNVSNVTTNGGNDGSATVTANGGTSPYTVTWTPGNMNTFAINTLTYGVYTASVTDANGCKINASTIVNEPRCLGFTAVGSGTNVSCNKGADGIATVSVTGGAPTYTYSWNTSPVQTGSTATGLPAGVITCVITDTNNCIQTANVVITEPNALTTTMSYTNVTILNGNNGSAMVNPFGGTIPYSYLWNFGPTTQSVTGLIAGTYSVTVTDNKGCTKSDNVKINQPPCDNLIINVVTSNVTCNGGENGQAVAVVSGASNYTLTWSNGGSGLTKNNLQVGNYSVTVTDGNCTNYANFSITQPPLLSIGLLPTNVSCKGFNNGSIDATISGGTFPYSISWNNGTSSEDQANLMPGSYAITVIDANGCYATANAMITEPPTLTATPNITTVKCINGNDGAISLNVQGGTAPFTYSWSTGSNAASINSLAAGGYSVTVKDINNCVFTSTVFSIKQPDSLKISTFTVNCPIPGSGQALATVTPTGGISGMYQVSFDNGATFQPAGNYSALLNNNATYSIAILDGNNCTSLSTYTIFVRPDVTISNVAYTKCYPVGTTTTPVVVTPAGGDNGPYQISTNNGVSYQAAGNYTFNANVASTYSVVVRDNRGCVSTVSVITLPTVLNATTAITSTISCFNLTDGAANVTAFGGTGAYSYTWSPTGGNNASALNLGAGNYSVSVSDANNCIITKTLNLINPTQVTATAVATSNFNGVNVSCNGFSNGTASVSANGGTGSYTYQWNTIPTQTAQTANTLAAGTHSVLVKDANNCAVTATVSLTQPTAAVNATAVVTSNYNGQNISCFGLSDGSASVIVSGGTGAYTYTWTTSPAQNAATANSLAATGYSVTVADVNGCSVVRTVTLTQPSQLAGTTSITSNYNGQNISCFGLSDGSASVTATGGTGAYTYTWNTSPAQNTAGASSLAAQAYTVTVKDANLCTITRTVALTQPTAISSTAAITSTITCFNYTNGVAQVNASGGTGAYTYTWNPTGGNNATASNLGSGVYSVTVADVNNCATTKTVNMVNPTQVTATAVATSNYNGSNVSCFGNNDGTASVTATGGTGSYNYQWNTLPVQTAPTATALAAGTHSVIVTDGNNCSATATVSLTQPTAGIAATASVISNFNGFNVSCFGSSNATAVATASNGTAPYSYTWTTIPSQISPTVTNIGVGSYVVNISDINGCSISKTVTVTEPNALVASTSVTSNYNGEDVSCFGSNNGSASVTVTGGTGVYTYTWSTSPAQNSALAGTLTAGTYTASITDNNGCAVSQTVTLTQPPAMNAVLTSTSNYNGYNVSCFNYTNASVDISINGGTGAYTYTWSNNANTQDINNIGAGSYSVVAMDVNGCTDTLNVLLTQPNQIVLNIDSISNFNGYNVKCYGSNNGTVYVSVTGGVPNYNYAWSNGSTNQNLNNVPSGSYYMSLTDLNNCFAYIDTVLTQPQPLTNTVNVAQPLCNGVNNGSISISVSGGVSPVTYTWSNGINTATNTNVGVGTYSVVYTDANGCKDSTAVVVNEPQSITATKEVDKIKCYGDTTSNIRIDLIGGTSPFTYTWSNGSSTKDLSTIGSGTYILVATDVNGCIFKDTTIVSQPDSLGITLYSPTYAGGYNISLYNGNDGSIDLTVNGGTSPYSFIWSNGATTEDVSGLTAYYPNPFPYSVIVTDSNGCKVTGRIELKQPLILEMPTAYSPNGDGKNDNFVVHGIEAFPKNVITIFNRWGNVVYTKSEYNNEWDGHSKNGELLPDGTYFVILEINKGEKNEIILKGYVELRRY